MNLSPRFSADRVACSRVALASASLALLAALASSCGDPPRPITAVGPASSGPPASATGAAASDDAGQRAGGALATRDGGAAIGDATSNTNANTNADAGADVEAWPAPHPSFVASLTPGVCNGDCAVYTVTVRGDGTFVIAVESPRKGCISGNAPLASVGKIEGLARKLDFARLKPAYETQQHDRRWMTTSVTLDGRTHKVRRWGYDEKVAQFDAIVQIENAIESATSSAKLSETGALTPCPKK